MPVQESPIPLEQLTVSDARAAEYHAQFEPQIGDLKAAFETKKFIVPGYEITATYNLYPLLANLPTPEMTQDLKALHRETLAHTKTIILLDLEPATDSDPLLHDRRAVLMETRDGKRATIAVALHDQRDSNWWFGGAGNYEIPQDIPSDLGYCVRHSEDLATTMSHKAYEIGTPHLAGTKVIIGGDDWLKSQTLQTLTGMLFSKRGLWPNIITGSDANQSEKTIAQMELGSRIGEGIAQIVGILLPETASYARHTMQVTYEALRLQYPQAKLPDWPHTTASVQALGKIGSTTAEMLIDMGVPNIYVTDINPQAVAETFDTLRQKADAKGIKLVWVDPEEIWNQDADIFCPCSWDEGIITYERTEQLASHGIKVILSGANNPFEEAPVATFAQQKLGILTPPETLANGGSATAAAMETEYLKRQAEFSCPEEFISKILIPHIQGNSDTKMAELLAIMAEQNTSLYEAGDIAYRNWRAQLNPLPTQ